MEAIEEAAHLAEDIINRKAANNPDLQKTLTIVRSFLEHQRVLCYGGTAINNLLPRSDQFYDPELDIPDYDFFSETPQKHAMRLADLLDREGITRVEVRPGVHMGTFKVFANYTGVADITFLDKAIFEQLWAESVEKNHIHYVSPDFLRMSVYLELSRPRGDVSRWTKVYKRLMLLNEHYPITCPGHKESHAVLEETKELARYLATHKAIVLGLHASQLHLRKDHSWDLPLDLLVTPDRREEVVGDLQKMLGAKAESHPPIGEILPAHTDLRKGSKLVARVYETLACHSYHKMKDGMRVASIPTILQFFFAFLYADAHTQKELDKTRLLCVAQQLVDIAHGESHGRRFKLLTPIDCLGKQDTLIDVRAETAHQYQELLKKGRYSPEFLRSFFTYSPRAVTKTQKQKLVQALRRTQRNKRTVRS